MDVSVVTGECDTDILLEYSTHNPFKKRTTLGTFTHSLEVPLVHFENNEVLIRNKYLRNTKEQTVTNMVRKTTTISDYSQNNAYMVYNLLMLFYSFLF